MLGVSSYGTAITLASLMGGLGLGAYLAGRFAKHVERPLLAYAVAEIVVGIGGLLVKPGLALLNALDPTVYAWSPAAAWLLQILGTAFFISIPATAMGTTLPLLAPCARDLGVSTARLYAANTAGAVIGILFVSFALLPMLGIRITTLFPAAADFIVAAWAFRHAYRTVPLTEPEKRSRVPTWALLLAFYTGLVVFALEVAWFRSLRAAFQASTESFAIILAAFILPLAVSAAVIPRFANTRGLLHFLLFGAGAFVFAATPFIERMDEWVNADFYSPLTSARRLVVTTGLMALPVALIGGVFPLLLARNGSSADTGRLFASNTLGAIFGTLLAGFVLLPVIGATRASWIAAASMFAVGMITVRKPRPLVLGCVLAGVSFMMASTYHKGGARDRVQGYGVRKYRDIAFVSEGPDSTVWVAHNHRSGVKKLVIDGFEASGEHGLGEHYMRWMGHLPALALGESIDDALVICFGTGQTANAVRKHRPSRLDIADVNAAVFLAAPLFSSNEGVLQDPAVHHTVMDGRKFLQRRPESTYDLITLEPMPPNFAGTNNLYSTEFYELARSRMTPRGVIAQWLPIHIIAPSHVRAILASFVDVFPHAALWIDPVGGTGIVIGGSQPWEMQATNVALDLEPEQIRDGFLLGSANLKRFVAGGPRVTDDNQLLAYGVARLTRSTLGKRWWLKLYDMNIETLRRWAIGDPFGTRGFASTIVAGH